MDLATDKLKKIDRKTTLSNTFYLQALLIVSYLCSFVLQAYLTRILGATLYGELFLADKLMLAFSFFLDSGYLLFGAALIEQALAKLPVYLNDTGAITLRCGLRKSLPAVLDRRFNLGELCLVSGKQSFSLSELWSVIVILKTLAALVFAVFLLFYALFFAQTAKHFLYIYGLFLLAAYLEKLQPDFVYRGLQAVWRLLIATVLFKVLLLVSHVYFVRAAQNYVLVPHLFVVNFLLLFLFLRWDIQQRYQTKFLLPSFKKLHYVFKQAIFLAGSRLTSSLFVACTWLFLYNCAAAPKELGYFAVADLLLTTGKKVMMLFSESLYPYFQSSRDWGFYRRLFCFLLLSAYGGILFFYLYGGQLLALVFGSEYVQSFAYLQTLLLSAVFIVPSALLGYPFLVVNGYLKAVNYSLWGSLLLYLLGLLYLLLSRNINLLFVAQLYNLANGLELVCKLFLTWRVCRQGLTKG